MKGIVDRFEGNFVVIELENLDTMDIPIDLCPPNIQVGQAVFFDTANRVHIDHDRTKQLQKEEASFFDDFFE